MIASLFILSCSRDWNNPFETDADLSHPPLITNVQLDVNRVLLALDYSYSNDCTLLFERKSGSAFEPLNLQKISASVFADTTLDMEQSYNLVYRFKTQKSGYTSNYSNEQTYSYVSNTLNAPTGLSCSSIEMQGVRLSWTDKSSKETGYRIDKNVNGAGFVEAADLPANTTTWLDAIPGMPATPQSIIYRIRAYNTSLNSAWAEQNVLYSGLGAPSNLRVVNPTFYNFSIAWTRNSGIATGYQIERRTSSGQWTIIAIEGATSSSYSEMINEVGVYSYRVRAVAYGNFSTYSNEISAQITGELPDTLPSIAGFTPIGKFQGHLYYTSTTEMTWQNAKITCEAITSGHGHLVTIGSAEENSFLPVPGVGYWIGLTDEAEEGVWQWVTGEPLTYENWRYNEPNDENTGEDYVEIYGSSEGDGSWAGLWNDLGGPSLSGYVLQFYLEIDPLSSVRKSANITYNKN